MDFDLERLNTRSFEQLVQALCLEVIGRHVVVFGDGPDGGREATFNGRVAYPNSTAPWDGYGVVQAKFRQIPDAAPKKNADWAIQQLKAEFKKFKPQGRPRRRGVPDARICPDYYVFATNLVLSAKAGSGGKDRFTEVLEAYRVSHGLKGYVVWDGDHIRRMLEAQPGIRMSYAAWILPGDVLGSMMQHLGLHDSEFPSTVRRFLECELLDDQFAKLGQGGYTEANTIPLPNVFVDVPVLAAPAAGHEGPTGQFERQQRETLLRNLLEEGRQVLRPSVQPQRNLPGHKSAACSPGRVVLIGGPGQGKTTAGQFCCQLLRAALLTATRSPFSPEVRSALEQVNRQAQTLTPATVLRYPLRIDLKLLATALSDKGPDGANSVLDFLVKHIARRTDSNLRKNEFRTWLRSYPWLLVLDGLDEVPASSNRTAVMDAIRDFVSVEANQLDADLLVLATTRPQGYSDEFDPAIYRHLHLLPLQADEALQYGSRLAEARHPGRRGRILELQRALQLATTNPATAKLMESPLQVTIMLALIEGGGLPPEQRWKLFHDYYNVIYRREKERNTPFSSLLGSYEADIHWIHHRAGWLLQQRNAEPGNTAARLTHKEFDALVLARLEARGHRDTPERAQLIRRIREAATDRLVMLVGHTADEIGFEIRSLQEFMAAEHCFDGGEQIVQASARQIAPHAYWRNAFLFVAGRIFFNNESLVDSLIAVCHKLNEPLSDPVQTYAATGSRLALAMLADGACRNQPENARVLARLAAPLLDRPWFDETLAWLPLFHGDASDVLIEELDRRLRAKPFSATAWALCAELAVEGDPWANDALVNRFPWTDCDPDEFASRIRWSSWERLPPAFWSALSGHLFELAPLSVAWIVRRLPTGSIPVPGADALRILGGYEPSTAVTSLQDRHNRDVGAYLSPDRRDTHDFWLSWAGLRLPANAHPGWKVLEAVGRFVQRPSRALLAESVKQVLEAAEPGGWIWRHYLPWQFGAALEAREAGQSAANIVSDIAQGKLGDTADWARWDRLRTLRIEWLGHPDGCLSASDDALGARYGSQAWQFAPGGHPMRALQILLTLVTEVPKLVPESTTVRSLVWMCCRELRDQLLPGSADVEHALRSILTGTSAGELVVTSDLLVSILRSEQSASTKASLLAMPMSIETVHWFDNWQETTSDVDNAWPDVVQAAVAAGTQDAVVRKLAAMPPSLFAASLPAELLQAWERLGGDRQDVARVLRLYGLNWRLDDAAQRARDAGALHAAMPRQFEALLMAIDNRQLAGPEFEAFMFALMQSPSPSPSPASPATTRRHAGALVRVVERRPPPSKLPDPTHKGPPPTLEGA